ncbi:MAG: hypothetical protein J2P43_14085 [Candidatus Dormibacteraeota bacterium]|nr:hypothetical protein [Candidatus Dormibacteraeota bacterium]
MARRSAARLLALFGLLVVVALDVVLSPPVLPTVKSFISPGAAPTPATTGTPAATATPVPGSQGLGTYWACGANETDNGIVDPNAQPPPHSVPSALCNSTYGETRPGQSQPPLPSGIEIWRYPVGTFRMFVDCGMTVANIVDPYDTQAPPEGWSGDHEVLFDASWNQLRSRNC